MKTATKIPIPARTHPNAKWSIQLKGMAVGESILLKTQNEANSMRIAAKRLGIGITQRKVSFNGIRVWKTTEPITKE